MNKEKVIWIFNHYASFLEARHLELSRYFNKCGYKCVIVASSFHHGTHKYIYDNEYVTEEREDGIKFVYLHTRPAYQKNGINRVLSFFDYNRLIKKHLKDIESEYGIPTYIIASSLHPLVWEIGNHCAQHYKIKWVAEVKDLWPLQLIKLMRLPKWHPVVVFFGAIERRAYRRANAIVTSMPYAYKYISDELGFPREKVHWMANGINTAAIDKYLEEKTNTISDELDSYLKNNWCCVYCGSLVNSECVPFIVESIKHVKDLGVHLAIIGSGHSQQEICDTIKRLNLSDNVRMFPRVSAKQIPVILKEAKCCIAAHHNNELYSYGLSMCKLNDYLYSGKPTIFACGARSVVDDAGGISIEYGDVELLASKIKEVKNYSQSKLTEIEINEKAEIKKNYDYEGIAERYIALLESL